jgi:simple sugar transport system permease protein
MSENGFAGKSNMRSNFFKRYTPVWEAFLAIIVGFIIGGLVISWSGFNSIAAILRMLEGGFGSAYYLTTTLTRSIPIIFAGFAAALAWGSGYPSLGASGQMILGAMISSQIAISIDGSAFVIIVLSILGGMIAGMIYSFISGWISDRFQIYLLIVTLMMNYIADNITSYFTHYFIKDPFGLDSSAIQTQKIEVGFLPRIFSDFTTHYGFIIALVLGGILWFIKYRTVFGYRARMGGLNALFAEYGGLNSKKMMYGVLLLSGAMAGLGGACEVLGTRFRYVDGMISSSGYVWSGIIASLIANNHPIGIVFSSIFLAGLTTGGSAVERSMSVPSEVSAIIQSIITLLMTAKFIVSYRHGKFGIFKKFYSKTAKRISSIKPGKVENK